MGSIHCDHDTVEGVTQKQLDEMYVKFQQRVEADFKAYTHRRVPATVSERGGVSNAIARAVFRLFNIQKSI